MKPCHQCPPSRCPQHTHMLCRPAGASAPRCCLRTLQQVPSSDTPGPWGDPSVYPASPRSIVPSWLRWLGCLPCPSPPCTHAHVHAHAWCPRRCSLLPGCVGVCAGVAAQSPPSPAAPRGAPWAGRAARGGGKAAAQPGAPRGSRGTGTEALWGLHSNVLAAALLAACRCGGGLSPLH